jgi:hypothetical protein
VRKPSYDESLAEALRAGPVTSSGDATDRCQCPTCGETFTTEANFDRHLAPRRIGRQVRRVVVPAGGIGRAGEEPRRLLVDPRWVTDQPHPQEPVLAVG